MDFEEPTRKFRWDEADSDDLRDQDLSFAPRTTENPYSVSELTQVIKSQLEGLFHQVAIVGEISNFKAHSSGHFYFSLKDETASISAVMFRGSNQHLRFKPSDGQRVIGVGKITVYPPRGGYQIVLSRMMPDGVGDLQLAFEQLKKKLQAEGLFEDSRKRALPKFPACVGVVTSPTGAAIRDILNVLSRRFAGLRVIVFPARVQGEGAAEEVSEMIDLANAYFPEIEALIVGRGGGSLEDLWAFNEEVVARALARSQIPTISAVGHEVDFTIADFVADLRAPTPSAAAELVIASQEESLRHIESLTKRLGVVLSRLEMSQMKVDDLHSRLLRSLGDKARQIRFRLERARHSLHEKSPFMRLKDYQHRYSRSVDRLLRIPSERIEKNEVRLKSLQAQLKLLNPKEIMSRGYSIVRLEKSKTLVKKAADVKMGDTLIIELSKGQIKARV